MARRRNEYARTRCVDGRTMRHDPQPDDPSLETDIGKCEECGGKGCETTVCQVCGAQNVAVTRFAIAGIETMTCAKCVAL